jgi:tetratricopeptide (TPR) repeat protein
MKVNKVIKINQTLHGYSDGHKLIESTISLSRESERIMLIMSDMSGQSMARGFESYITGYPLQKERLYSFARTWYASEMKRPGCVWTHTLLIDFDDLVVIKEVSKLISLFTRPLPGNVKRINYNSILEISSNDMSSVNFDSIISLEITTPIIKALYVSDEQPIIIPAMESLQYEALIIAIWNQQWPSLKKSFYFCTGAIANRKIDSKIFDLQVVPFLSVNDIKRELRSAVFIDALQSSEQLNIPEWVRCATDDLNHNTESVFRPFLWKYADDVKGGRSSFERLAKTFLDIEKVKLKEFCLSDLTNVFSKNFPDAQTGKQLKTAIYGGYRGEGSVFLPHFSETELLRELLTTSHYQIFDPKMLKIRQRAKELWQNDRLRAKELLSLTIKSNLNVLGEEFLKGLSDGFELTEITEFAENKNALIYIFVRLNPNIATSSRLWSLVDGREQEVIDVINTTTLEQKVKIEITKAILNTNIMGLAGKVGTYFKEDAVEALLDWVNDSPNHAHGLFSEWQYLLKNHPTYTLDWLMQAVNPPEHTINLITSLLDPNSSEVVNKGACVWVSFAQKIGNELGKKSLVETIAFLLTLSFNNPKDGACELARLSFEIVHDSVANSELESHSWQNLEKHLPSLSWWRNWDRCERLRRGLVESYINYYWPVSNFFETVRQEETFKRIVEFCNTTIKGKKFLTQLLLAAQDGKKNVTEAQWSILQKIDQFSLIHDESFDNNEYVFNEAELNKDAMENAQQDIKMYQRLAQNNSDGYTPDLATALNTYASILIKSGQNASAIEYAEQALKLHQQLAQKNPDKYTPDLATALNTYASILIKSGQNASAIEYAEQALKIRRHLTQKKSEME